MNLITHVIVIQVSSETIGEIGHRHCLRIQDLGTEFRQPKAKVPART